MKKLILSILGLAYASALFAADTFMIETNIIKGKQVIDSPALIAPFKQAGVAEAKKGKNSYELLMQVDEVKNGVATLYTNLTLNGKFYKQKAKVPLKEKVALNVGDVKIDVRVIPYK